MNNLIFDVYGTTVENPLITRPLTSYINYGG